MLLAFLLFLLYSNSFAEDSVPQYDDKNFGSNMAEHNLALVMFYAPWCDHCKKVKPEFEKAAAKVKAIIPSTSLVKVDCTESGQEICELYKVESYPKLKVFTNGDFLEDYEGPREAKDIVDYVKAMAGPIAKEVSTMEELVEFLKADATLLGVFEEDTKLKTSFTDLANQRRKKLRFAQVSEGKLLEDFGSNSVVLFRPFHLRNRFEEDSVKFLGNPKVEDLQDFVSKNLHGLVGHRRPTNVENFHHPLIVTYYDIDFKLNPKGTSYWRNRVLKVAKNYQNLNFAISSKEDFQEELIEFGVEFNDQEPLVLARNSKNQKVVLGKNFSVEALEDFAQNLDQLEPYIKSQPLPETNEGVVKIAVASNFEEVVLNNGRDTLVEFYAPWCVHCKELEPIFEKLGEKMKGEEVAVVKMDATANEIPEKFEVKGFPTLYWLRKDGNDAPVKYEGGREMEDLVKFVAKHSTEELRGFDREGNARKVEL